MPVPENLGRGDRLDDNFFLTNDPRTIRKLVPENKFLHYFGACEYSTLLEASEHALVAYIEVPAGECGTPADAEEYICVQLLKLAQFANYLWMIKDNAIKIENGFFIGPDFGSTRLHTFLSGTASGSDDEVTFSRAEFKAARETYRKFHPGSAEMSATEGSFLREIVEPDIVPFARAIYFIGSARLSYCMSVKIANYCTALESLLVSSASEVTYRLGQRVAWMLGTNPEERLALFDQLKSAYDFRSKAVHGGFANAKKIKSDLVPAVVACDDIVRRVLARVTEIPEVLAYVRGANKRTEDFESALMALTMGRATEAAPQLA